MNDILNVHKVSRKFNKLATLLPTKMLIDGTKTAGCLYHNPKKFLLSTRIFEEVTIKALNEFTKNLNLEEIFQKFGEDVRKLKLDSLYIDIPIFPHFLRFFENLESLVLVNLGSTNRDTVDKEIDDPIELPNLKSIEIDHCRGPHKIILQNLRGCSIKEVKFSFVPDKDLLPFLTSQEKNVRKLTLSSNSSDHNGTLFASLPNMRLEYFEYSNHYIPPRNNSCFLNFLKQHCEDLKFFSISGGFACLSIINLVFETLVNLETLKIDYQLWDEFKSDSFDGVQNLVNLRSFTVEGNYQDLENFNILNGLSLAVNKYLEELKVPFIDTTNEFINELTTFIPNLKRLHVSAYSKLDVELALKSFKNLEILIIEIKTFEWEREFPLSETTLDKLETLHIKDSYLKLDTAAARNVAKCFPNLSHFQIDFNADFEDKTIKILLKDLKKLKRLKFTNVRDHKMSQEYIEKYVEWYGINLLDKKLFHKITWNEK